MKHIESILPENVAAELARLLSDDATISLTLKDLLHRDTGCDIPSLDNIPSSDIEEVIPLCLSILRRFWNTPLTALGDGTNKKSLADTFKRLINNRVQGNEAWSIPAIHANIPTAVSALLDRKIGGVPQAPDGISLVQLVCGDYNNVTELTDDTIWEGGKNINTLVSLFPNLAKVVWSAQSHSGSLVTGATGLTELELPNLRTVTMVTGNPLIRNIGVEELTLHITSYQNYYAGCVMGCTSLKKLTFDELESIRLTNDNDNRMIGDCSALEEVYAEKLGNVYVYRSTDNHKNGFVSNCAALKKLCFGYVTAWTYRGIDRETGAPNLIDLRFKSVSCSLDLWYWNPSNALDASLDTLVTDEDCHNNLEQFLKNFRTYIAQRLTDKGSGLTLTLSQAVRDAIQQDPEIVSIITSKGWTISPAPSV